MSAPVTHIATADATRVIVRGRDLVNDLIGKYTFTEIFYFLVCERFPTPAQTRVPKGIFRDRSLHKANAEWERGQTEAIRNERQPASSGEFV